MLGFVIFAFVVAIAVAVFLCVYRPPPSKESEGIPGDSPTSRTKGNLDEVVKLGLHGYLVDLHARHGPLASFYLGEELVVSAASPKLFAQLALSFNRPVSLFKLFEPLITEHSLQYLNDEEGEVRHKEYRACFQDSSLKSFYGIFNDVTRHYVDLYSGMGDTHINISRDMFHLAMRAITRSAFGDFFSNDEELEILRKVYEAVWSELEGRLDMQPASREREDTFIKNREKMYALVRRCLEERQRQREIEDVQQDSRLFIDKLLDDRRPQEENIGEAVTFLVGGFHTTGNLLAWAIYCLCLYPEVQDKVAAEAKAVLRNGVVTPDNRLKLKYTKQVIDETLRWATLAPWAARYYNEDTDIGGHTIPAETPIIVALGVVLQDPVIWDCPHVFNPDRFAPEAIERRPARSHEAFGLAKRKCPGYQFANLETVIVLSTLCRQFKFSLVDGPEITKEHGFVTHPSRDICVTVKQR